MYSMKRTSAGTVFAELDQVRQLVVVDAAHTTVSSFVPVKPAAGSAPMPARTCAWLERPREPGEAIGTERVEAHGDAMEAGRLERPRLLRQQDAVVVIARSRRRASPRAVG